MKSGEIVGGERRVCLAALCVLMLWGGFCRGAESSLGLVSVEPTVLFVRQGGDLLQVAEATVENGGETAEAAVEVKVGAFERTLPLGAVAKGKSTHRIHLPEVAGPTAAVFTLKSAGAARGRIATTWLPGRHWSVYVVPITHHDLGYTDTIENVLRRYAGFYDDVARFCAETDDLPDEAKYRYTIEGGWSLRHYVENRPAEAVEKLKKYVAAGRIEIGALFGNQISGLHGHEELIRLMYPSFGYARDFGGTIRCGSITDIPGLSWGLPTVMASAGVKYFFAGLPTYFEWGRNDIHTFWDESKILRHGRPDAFHWQGPDGQKVLVYYQGAYGFFNDVTGPHNIEYVEQHLPRMLKELEAGGCDFDVMRYIHNGVDNYPPDVVISRIVRQWNDTYAYPRLIVSTNTMFFEALEKQGKDLRTFSGELPHTDYAVGAVSTALQTTINRTTHDGLHTAEKAATIASVVTDFAYPADDIRRAYDSMLLYDEHTWGKDYPAGPIQDMAWNEKSHYAYRAAALTDPILRHSLERMAANVELAESGRHVVVFNPLSLDRTDIVRVPKFGSPGAVAVVDVETGKEVPHQIVKLTGPQDPLPYAAWRWARGSFEEHELYDLVFVAENVASVGYRTYRLIQKPRAEPARTSLSVGKNTIESRFYKVTLDPKTGAAAIYDKQLKKQLIDPKAPHAANQLVIRSVQTGDLATVDNVRIAPGQTGPVYASLTVTAAAPGCPQVTQEIVLYDQFKRIDFNNRLLKDSTPLQEVYFAFPFDIDKPRIRFEASNSVIEPFKDQFPGSNTNYYSVQHWAHAGDGTTGVTFSPVESHLVEFGGIWPCYVSQAHHGVDPPNYGEPFITKDQVRKGYMYAFVMDSNFRTNFQPVQQSDILFRYSITSQDGDWLRARPRDFGWSVGNPLTASVLTGPRKGRLPASASFCAVDQPNVLLLTLKRAEDGDGLIARLIETEGSACTAALTLPPVTIAQARRTDIVEKNVGELIFDAHRVEVPLRAFGISTVRITP
jgi:hypothetical protein